MGFKPVLIYLSPDASRVPELVTVLARTQKLRCTQLARDDAVLELVNRSFPACVVFRGRGREGRYVELCRALKRDPFSAVVPVIFHAPDGDPILIEEALRAGADEVLTDRLPRREQTLRFQMTLRRATRAVSVHPTTHLPGTAQIARDITERLGRDEKFAVCYADLDRFKEYNDRYGYSEGDRVILMVSRILRDIVKAYATDGFIGHIGGDDFIFNLPLDDMAVCCEEIIEVFDELIPYQYSEADREARYFLGKDRRGNLYRVPLMTLSIGVVTNENRSPDHPGQVSELATEMKAYAKTLAGSVYAVDRRGDPSDSTPVAHNHPLEPESDTA